MKKNLSFAFMVCLVFTLMGGMFQNSLQAKDNSIQSQGNAGDFTANWAKGPTEQWHIRMDTASREAQRENKKYLVLRTGSNWCGWCMKLYKDVLSTPTFTEFARENLVLVYMDLPNGNKMPDIQKIYNTEVLKAVNFHQGGYPGIIILDEDWEKMGTIGGYKPLDKFMEMLKDILNNNDKKSVGKRQWMTQSPEQLSSTLQQMLEKKQQDKEKAAKASEEVKSQAQFKIVAWGLEKDNVNNPFNPKTKITVPVDKDLFLKVQYQIPESIKAMAYVNMKPSVSRTSYGQHISSTGDFVSSMACKKAGIRKKIRIDLRLLMDEAKSFTAAEFPCNVSWE